MYLKTKKKRMASGYGFGYEDMDRVRKTVRNNLCIDVIVWPSSVYAWARDVLIWEMDRIRHLLK